MDSCSIDTRDWSGLATGQTDVILVSDGGIPNVGNMFKEPAVGVLAEQLKVCLNKNQVKTL